GLALGVDAAAHRGALNAGGVTVAVMGTGVDVIYPSAHSVLAEAIVSGGGALVSQFADGTAPRRHNFPARNYTMAALADVVVVVEAGEGSGALITAEAALDLHKEGMAVPGSGFSPLSVGGVLGRGSARGPDGAVKGQQGGFVRAWRRGKDRAEDARHSAVVRPAPEAAAGTKTRDWE